MPPSTTICGRCRLRAPRQPDPNDPDDGFIWLGPVTADGPRGYLCEVCIDEMHREFMWRRFGVVVLEGLYALSAP